MEHRIHGSRVEQRTFGSTNAGAGSALNPEPFACPKAGPIETTNDAQVAGGMGCRVYVSAVRFWLFV